MPSLNFTLEQPTYWKARCESHGDFFHSSAWLGLLQQAFGAITLYGSDETRQIGCTLSIFKAGPFRIGYYGFPIGGQLGSQALTADDILSLRQTRLPLRVEILRLAASAFDASAPLDFSYRTNPETAILNLDAWRADDHPKLRHDINRVRRTGIKIESATDGSLLYSLYAETVRRHGGSLRYNAAYFRALVDLARNCPALHCQVALSGTETIGFLIAVHHGKTAYYLHGATAPQHRKLAPSDLLIHEAIVWAQQRGVTSFNLMTSPAGQASLVRYKEKWGGTTREHRAYELTLKPWSGAAFRLVERVYGLVR